MNLRMATPADGPALLDVYREYIHTPITFEYDLPSPQEFSQRVSHILEMYPYLVAEENGKILGYAYAHPERPRPAYQWNAELSIYLRSSAAGKGVGTALYRALMALLALQGVRTVYGVVTAGNPASDGLHRTMGFRLLGVHQKTGFKNGQWYDVLWYEKAIAPYDASPAPLIPIGELPEEAVAAVLGAFS